MNRTDLPVTPARPARTAGTLQAIQYTRAIAAMLVVFYHQTVYLSRIAADSSLHDVFGGRPGLYGVVAFFVLSGFLMADIAPKYPPITFIVHRAIRIYPTYWLCVALASVFFSWLLFATRPNADFVPDVHQMLFGHGMSRDLLRLTLAPMVFPDFPLGIEWTLLYETTFYAMIFIVSVTGQLRFLPHLVVGWLMLILWAAWFQPAWQAGYTNPAITTLPFFGINAAFIFGVLAAKVRWRIPPAMAILLGVSLLVLVEFFPTRLNMIQTAAGMAALIMGLMGLEVRGMLPHLPVLRRFGDWSYAMYLVHVPVILATTKLLSGSPTWLIMTGGLAGVLLVSTVIGQMDVEAYRRLKYILDRGPGAVRVGLAIAFVAVFVASALWGLASH